MKDIELLKFLETLDVLEKQVIQEHYSSKTDLLLEIKNTPSKIDIETINGFMVFEFNYISISFNERTIEFGNDYEPYLFISFGEIKHLKLM